MQQSNAPLKLVLPFANAGSKNTIPTASQIGITAGAASLTDGFPPLTRTPLASGGVPPSGADMNGILFELSAVARWMNSGGGFYYDSTFANDANVVGYPKGATVLRTDAVGYWLNTVDNNVTDPEAGGAGWVPYFQYGITAVAMTNANVTLTALQAGKPIITITGLLTGNLNLILPTYLKSWTIVNNTTGAFTITAKTAAGTGIVATQTGVTVVYGDGTNILSASTAAAASGQNNDITALLALTGAVDFSRSTVAATATTTPMWVATTGMVQDWTGTPTITTFPNAPKAGAWRKVYPATGTVFTNSGSLTVQGGATYTSKAGDEFIITAVTTSTFDIRINQGNGNATVPAGIQAAMRNLTGNAGGTSAVVTYAADEITVGDNAGNFQTLRTWSGTVTMTSAGANGLDTGSVAASTWYNAFAIAKPDGTKGFLASLSATAPTMPSGYTKFARIGAFRTDGTGNKYPLSFTQFGKRVQYKVAAGSNVTALPIVISGSQGSISTPTWVAGSVSTFVPPTAGEIAVLLQNQTGTTGSIMVAPNNSYGAINSTTNPPLLSCNLATGFNGSQMGRFAIETSNIYYAANTANCFVQCLGWEDNI